MNVIEMPIAALKPYENNPRKNDESVKIIQKSISEYGFVNPILVDKNNVIIAGHTRYKACVQMGIDTVPVVVLSHLDENQVDAYRIMDNKSNEYAEWDFDSLKQEFEKLNESNFDLDLTGFNTEEWSSFFENEEEPHEEYNEDEDVIEDPPEVPQTKNQDLWILGRHRLVCGDSTSESDVSKLMDGAKASMVFTDPPWNVNYGAVEKGNAQGYKPRTILNDFMGEHEFKDFMNKVFANMNAASQDGCMTYVVMSAQEWGNLMLTLASNEYHWSSTIIWVKDRLVLSRKDYHTQYEPIWYGWKEGQRRLKPLDDRKQSDIWNFVRPHRSDLHPTTKPVDLIEQAIKNSSELHDKVLDLFGGSGSTLIACEQTNRINYSMELDPKYCDVIVKRYANLYGHENIYLIREGETIPYTNVFGDNDGSL